MLRSLPADTTAMGYNVAGTTALGDDLASQIRNTRILFGESPATGLPAGETSPSSASIGSSVSGAASGAASPPSARAQLAQDVAAAQLANTQTLFGSTPTDAGAPQAGALPAVAGQTPQQIEQVAIESSLIAQRFANTSTLFSSIGLGANLNRFA